MEVDSPMAFVCQSCRQQSAEQGAEGRDDTVHFQASLAWALSLHTLQVSSAGKGSSAHLVTNRLAKSVMTPQDGACVGILKQKRVCWGALKAVQKFKI